MLVGVPLGARAVPPPSVTPDRAVAVVLLCNLYLLITSWEGVYSPWTSFDKMVETLTQTRTLSGLEFSRSKSVTRHYSRVDYQPFGRACPKP